jgi:hypothetical protein
MAIAMLMQLKILASLMVVVAWSAGAFAQNEPIEGLVHDTRGWNSLKYSCKPTRDRDTLSCEMTETSVRRGIEPSELKKELDKAMVQWKAAPNEKPRSEECSRFIKIIDALRGSPNVDLPEETLRSISKMPEDQKQDNLKISAAMVKWCKGDTSAATFLEFVRLTLDVKSRTCIASSRWFTQTFKRVLASDTWTSNEGPTGYCGTVIVSTLKKDPKSSFWTYAMRKMVTNPTTPHSLPCTDIDQAEHFYDWRLQERFVKCDYLKFDDPPQLER